MSTSIKKDTRWIDTEAAAKLVGISGRWLRQLLDEGRLPKGIAKRLPWAGSYVRWNRDQLLAWVKTEGPEDSAE